MTKEVIRWAAYKKLLLLIYMKSPGFKEKEPGMLNNIYADFNQTATDHFQLY